MFHRHPITLVILILPLLRSAQGAAQTASAAEQTVPAASSSASRVGTALQVSQNGRHLVDREGRPFFWLGDTAWLLFQMTVREDADLYLKTRASQGFTVIQAAVVMGEERVGGTLRPNVYGDLAFVGGNPAKSVGHARQGRPAGGRVRLLGSRGLHHRESRCPSADAGIAAPVHRLPWGWIQVLDSRQGL